MKLKEAEIEQIIKNWHESDDPRELHEALGMSWDEYKCWATQKYKTEGKVDLCLLKSSMS